MEFTTDIAVLGSGPAGLACAAAFSALGARVSVVSPDPDALWTNTYGAWLDDIPDAELRDAMTATWPQVRIHHTRSDLVHRSYGLVDRQRWQSILRARCSGISVVYASALGADHDRRGSTLHLDSGPMRARLVVDATGTGRLLSRSGGATLYQVAYGELVEADIGADMRWMEFGAEGSFLYAMPLGHGRAFVEETVLATATPPAFDVLRERLHRRLATEGIATSPPLQIERCSIPMDRPVPPAQRVLGFGAAASFVHPASGFQLPRALQAAPLLAAAVLPLLDEPERAARAGWEAIWPTWRRRARAIHTLAARTLATLPPAELPDFFDAFFALPDATRDAWLADALPAAAVARTMTDMFFRLRPGLALRMLAGGRSALTLEATR